MSEELWRGKLRFRDGGELCWACMDWYVKPGAFCDVCGLPKKPWQEEPSTAQEPKQAAQEPKGVWCCVCRQWFDKDEAIALRYKRPLDQHGWPPRTEPGGRCSVEATPNPESYTGEIWVCKPCAKVITEAGK
jgi:predicted amidophosphoribosyltransferase